MAESGNWAGILRCHWRIEGHVDLEVHQVEIYKKQVKINHPVSLVEGADW